MARRGSTKGTNNELVTQLEKILNDYSTDVRARSDAAFRKVSKECVSRLKADSPSNNGDYKNNWTQTRRTNRKGLLTYVVYNRQWQLTHLLENGHIEKNQYGYVGTKRMGQKIHIKPVADWAANIIVETIESSLEK